MFDIIGDALGAVKEFFGELGASYLRNTLEDMFTLIDDATALIAGEIAKTPEDWNSDLFTTLQSISETVILPIGTMIITAILCYEIISMVVNQNHIARDGGETSFFFIIIFKAMAGVYFLAHSWEIACAIFDVGAHIVKTVTNGYLTGTAESLGVWGLNTFNDEIEALEGADLLIVIIEASLVSLAMSIMSVIIMVILYGRMVEIYMYLSVAPIPFSTLLNREWGQIGNNYIRSLLALAFQTFFIIICVVIFNVMVTGIVDEGLKNGLKHVLIYSVLLCVMLFKSGGIAKSIFNAH